MNMFIHLLAGHLIGDFALQTGAIARMKRTSYRGLLLHVSIVCLATVPLTAFLPSGLTAAFLVCLGHLLIDAVRTGPLRNLTCCTLTYFLTDQLAHLLLIAAVAFHFQPQLYDTPADFLRPYTPFDSFLLLLSALIFLTFVVPIVEAILYKDLVSGEATIHLKVTNRLRLLGSLERVTAFLLCLSPWGYLAPLVFVPHYLYRFTKSGPEPLLYRLLRPTLNMVCAFCTAWVILTVSG